MPVAEPFGSNRSAGLPLTGEHGIRGASEFGYGVVRVSAVTGPMVEIPSGSFRMGATGFYPEEGPVRTVGLKGFRIDRAPVTRDEFARFVEATGYVTVAERALDPDDYPGIDVKDLAPGSLVFSPTAGPVDLDDPGNWWRFVSGANWRDTPAGNHPVVQVAFEDVMTYAEWCGKSLPTEAEWEYAARGGLDGAVYPWGDDWRPDGRALANTWEGDFPWRNTERDGYAGTSPVGTYPPNGYGLLDMVGNVWEWTGDWWSESDASTVCCAPEQPVTNPRGGLERDSFDPMQPGIRIPRKVLKGGSHLCSPSYCLRYRPAARIPQMIDTATSHIGFRCVVRDG